MIFLMQLSEGGLRQLRQGTQGRHSGLAVAAPHGRPGGADHFIPAAGQITNPHGGKF